MAGRKSSSTASSSRHQVSAEPGFAEESSQSYVVDFLASTEGLQLNRAFLRVRDPKVRRRIVDLVIALASPQDESVDDASVR